jgi:hypothetical protein
MGITTRYLLPHRYVDESTHRANLYLLDLDHELETGVYERQPGSGLDRSPKSKALCTESLKGPCDGQIVIVFQHPVPLVCILL